MVYISILLLSMKTWVKKEKSNISSPYIGSITREYIVNWLPFRVNGINECPLFLRITIL